MKVTVEFTDGSYLLVEDEGDFCVFESLKSDFQGSLKDTLNIIPTSNKVELVRSILKTHKQHIRGNYDYINGGYKAIKRG